MQRNRYACLIAGTLELFVGAYFVTFGSLAAVYFEHMRHPRVALLAIAAAFAGLLLMFRAQRLLGWKRWFFAFVALPMLLAPVACYLPPLLAR